MPISPSELLSGKNGCLIAHKDDVLNDLLARLAAAKGYGWWYLLVDWGDGSFRVTRFGDLVAPLKQNPQRVFARLAGFDLPVAQAVDQSADSAETRRQAQKQSQDVVVVTQNGKAIGLLRVSSKRTAEWPNILDYYRRETQSTPPPTTNPTERFEAYPLLKAKDIVRPLETFEVTVGFQATPDADLLEQQRISVEKPAPDDKLLVMLIGDGVEVLDGIHRQLPLDMAAHVMFTCRPKSGVSYATISVHYVYNHQVVGMAKRALIVASMTTSPLSVQPPKLEKPACSLTLPGPETATDLQVTITRLSDQQLAWTLIAPDLPVSATPIKTPLTDTRAFAAQLISELRNYQYKGEWAHSVLLNIGQEIASHMPTEFFAALQQAQQRAGPTRAVTLLLLSDEPYVPWELAVLPTPLKPDTPPFLAAQTCMGRWLLDPNVGSVPPVRLTMQSMTAVASKYGLGSDQRELKQALAEQKALQEQFQAKPVEATLQALSPVVNQKAPGHFIHFAVHGLSDPQANEEALLLADKTRLTPRALVGSYQCGQVPRFTFVFLNACQVGTAGSSLGQAAGFPATLIRGGAQAFIAPLWEVHDEVAQRIAEAFYRAVLKEDGQTVAEFWQTQRMLYDAQASTTPIAYIYYGHPALKLQRPK